MAHNSRTESDATWTNGGAEGYSPLRSDWEDLERKLFTAINGDKGGVYAPTVTIDFGTPGNPGLRITGVTLVGYGGRISTAAGSRVRIDGGFPLLGANHPGRTRKIINACVRRQATQPYHWSYVAGTASARSIACTIQGPAASLQVPGVDAGTVILEQPSFHLPLRVQNGGTLTKATFSFTVEGSRSGLPVAPPKFRIVASDVDGNLFPLKLTADGTGYASPTPSTAAEWTNGNVAQHFDVICDQNNVIDTSAYVYFAQVIEESGATSLVTQSGFDGVTIVERKLDCDVATTGPLDHLTGALVIDGVSVGLLNSRVLVKDQALPDQNGIWIASATGDWTRATDCDDPTDFTAGFIVAVKLNQLSRTQNGGTVWQLQSPTVGQKISVAPIRDEFHRADPGTPIVFTRGNPRGNSYHSVLCTFEEIPDLRFQT